MTTSYDILKQLLPLEWRGIQVPAQENSIDVQNRLIEHEQAGVRGAHVEDTGRKAMRMSFRVPFFASLTGYKDLYPTTYRKFFDACLDSSIGSLVHPEYGELDVKVEKYSVKWNPRARSGCEMDVTWVETNENRVIEDAPILTDVIQDTALLEGNLSDMGIPPFDDGSGMSLLDSLKQLASLPDLLDMELAAALGKIEGMIAAINNLMDALQSVSDPKASSTYDGLLEIVAKLDAFKESGRPAGTVKKVGVVINTTEQPPTQMANNAGMKLEEFFALNPALGNKDTVPVGYQVFVVQGG